MRLFKEEDFKQNSRTNLQFNNNTRLMTKV